MESSGFLSPKLKYREPRELKPPTELITVSSPVTGPFPMGLWQAKVVSGLDIHSHRLLLIFKKRKIYAGDFFSYLAAKVYPPYVFCGGLTLHQPGHQSFSNGMA